MIIIDTPEARLEFPPDTAPDIIRRSIAENAIDEPSRQSALKQWADQFVANERSQGGIGQAVGDVVRNVARGTPIGSWLDEANALTSSAMSNFSGGQMGAPYDESVAYQRATDKAIEKESPITSLAGQLTGAVASIPAAPVAQIVRGTSMLPQIANAAATGLGYGALYGAGEGETVADRGRNAAVGGGIGGGLGVAVPVVARGVSNTLGYVADKFKGIPQSLGQFERGAVSRVSRAAADDTLTPAAYSQRVAELGPEGMLADMGQNLTSQAGAVANQPGRGQSLLTEAMTQRRMGAPGRVSTDVDTALGPRINVIDAEQRIREHYGKQAAPLYEKFRQGQVPYTRDLEAIQRTLESQPDILRKARQFAALDGTTDPRQFFANIADDGTVAIKRVPNASEWDYVKRSLDDYARNANPGSNEQRIYGNLAGKVRGAIDEALSPGAPDQSIYARARGVAGEGIGLRKSLDEGGDAFTKGLSPDQMRADLSNKSSAERLAYALGARNQVSDIMGNSATAFGANGDTAARRALGSDYAREKLALVAGDPAAERLIRRLDAETAFERTRAAVTQNSATSKRLQAQKEFPNSVDNSLPRELGQRSLASTLLFETPYRIGNAALGGALGEKRANIAADAAKILSASGVDRDRIARALLEYGQSKSTTQAGKKSIERIVRSLLEGGRQPTIAASTD